MGEGGDVAGFVFLSRALRARGMNAQIRTELGAVFLRVWHPRLAGVGVCVGVRLEPGPEGVLEAWFESGGDLLALCSEWDRASGEVVKVMWPILAVVAGRS
ncbi:hypothetical protein EDD29_6967 [Actinocorallia herbida]|uniref:Uncharacterized protein n=1 Tax=Actinocorallia herbida TaxID=58109 RepID=A0A3N1D734_9ACTN|nr:hypothetical protein EDD29_6967 [Actinocorallia herbida]